MNRRATPNGEQEVEAHDEAYDEVHDEVHVTGEVAGEVAGEVSKLLKVLAEGALTRTDAQAALGLKSQTNFRDRYLGPALEAGLVEMTIPDKPRSSRQKYRLAVKGLEELKGIKKGGRPNRKGQQFK